MVTAFQSNAFQNNAFQVAIPTPGGIPRRIQIQKPKLPHRDYLLIASPAVYSMDLVDATFIKGISKEKLNQNKRIYRKFKDERDLLSIIDFL